MSSKMKKKKLGEGVKKKKMREVVDSYEGKMVSPGTDVYLEAVRNKKWLVGNHDNVEKVDYLMFEAILYQNITGIMSVFDGRTMEIGDMIKTFYIHLYPFIKNTIEQYIITTQELDASYDEMQKLSKNNAKYITENKLMLKYLEENGTIEEYEKFKTSFMVNNAPTPEEIG